MQKEKIKKFEKYKKGERESKASKQQEELEAALSSAVGRAELIGKNEGEEAKAKANEIRKLKKEQAIAKIEEEQKKIKELKVQKIEFGEYQPKFRETLAFRLIVLFTIFAVIGIGIGVYFVIRNMQREVPTSISLSATEFYYSEGDDFTLTAWLNSDYKGMNKNIKVSVVGGNGIVKLESNSVESGKPFKITVVKQQGIPVGGKVRLFVEDEISGKQRAYCDIIIDTPITSVVFNSSQSEVYVTEQTSIKATAFASSQANDISTVLGKKVSYRVFVNVGAGNGDYEALTNGLEITSFYPMAGGAWSCSDEDTGKIVKLNGENLEAVSNGKVYVEASTSKWLPQNSEQTSIYKVKEINCKLIPISSIALNEMYKDMSFSTVNLQNGFFYLNHKNFITSIQGAQNFSSEQLLKMVKFFKFEIKPDETGTNDQISNVQIINYEDKFGINFENVTSNAKFTVKVSYDANEDGTAEIEQTFTVSYTNI